MLKNVLCKKKNKNLKNLLFKNTKKINNFKNILTV